MNDNIKAGADIHAGDFGYSIGTQEKYDEFAKGRNQSLGKMRIRELAEQAGMYIVDDEFSTYGKFAEKFAQLIVRECADVANQHMEHNEGTDYNVGGKIKQHFGVEE